MSKWLILLASIGVGAVAYKRYRAIKEERERHLDYQISRMMPLALAFALDMNKQHRREG